MNKLVLDSNVFLRYLLKDIPAQYKEAEVLFRKAKKGKIELIVPQIVIFEIAFALSKYYSFPKEVVVQKIGSILATDYFQVQDKNIFSDCLPVYMSLNLSLSDCFIKYFARGQGIQIFTFDKALRKI